MLCTRWIEEARSARASLQAQLEAEEETRGEARQEEFGSMVRRGKELLERVQTLKGREAAMQAESRKMEELRAREAGRRH